MNGGISALLAVADAPVESPQEISCLSCRFSTGSITMKKKNPAFLAWTVLVALGSGLTFVVRSCSVCVLSVDILSVDIC